MYFVHITIIIIRTDIEEYRNVNGWKIKYVTWFLYEALSIIRWDKRKIWYFQFPGTAYEITTNINPRKALGFDKLNLYIHKELPKNAIILPNLSIT